MRKYFMVINWIDSNHQIMHIKDYITGNDEYIDIPYIIDMKKMEFKICSGTINPLTREFFSCNKLIETKQDQCYSCMHKYDFYQCVRCHGNDCTSKENAVIEYCNTPHYVYLAYFSRDKIKVGTVSEIRKYDRLLEQGAVFFIFIAKTPTGKIARQIEKNIIDYGMAGAVSTIFKMKNLVFDESIEDIKRNLMNNWQTATKYVEERNVKYLIAPEFNYFENIYKNIKMSMLSRNGQISMFKSQSYKINYYEISKESNYIKGKFLFIVGKIIALEQDNKIYLYDSKKWEGFLFDFKNLNTLEPMHRG